MRQITRIVSAVALLSAVGAVDAYAQENPTTFSVALAPPPPHAVDEARELIAIGDRHRYALQLDDAENAFREAAGLEQAAGRLPTDALWKLASVQHAAQRYGDAAATLDHLAALAERYGQPEVQARALLESVILHHRAGDGERARRSLDRLLPLRTSPHLPARLNEEIDRRLIP